MEEEEEKEEEEASAHKHFQASLPSLRSWRLFAYPP